jgi:hypothetical protein
MCWIGSEADTLRERSERVRVRGMLTGSIMIGGSSIISGASKDLVDFSSLSRCMERNLLDLRGCFDTESGDIDAELPLARLVSLLAGSVMDLERSRFVCF